jgi:hypothetical protein
MVMIIMAITKYMQDALVSELTVSVAGTYPFGVAVVTALIMNYSSWQRNGD